MGRKQGRTKGKGEEGRVDEGGERVSWESKAAHCVVTLWHFKNKGMNVLLKQSPLF